MTHLYLDHNATTPLDSEVRDAWLDAAAAGPGNPSSIHAPGREARQRVEAARERVARFVGADPPEIVFTSGGTEANNLAVHGALEASPTWRRHVVTTGIEHPSLLEAVRTSKERGGSVTRVPAGRDGVVDPEQVLAAVRRDTALVSVMLANNETGVVQPVAELAARLRERGIRVHTDAVQAAGKLPVDVRALGVDLLSISSHKLYGPMGAAALYVRSGVPLEPLLRGSRQERGLRPGTENVPAIAAFGRACELATRRLPDDAPRLAFLRDRLEAEVLARVEGARVNGSGPRLCNTSNLGFAGVDGQALSLQLDLQGVAVSTGAACKAGSGGASHVLVAMGLRPDEARGSVRVSLGRGQTEADVERLVGLLCELVPWLRREGR